ncbi:MAG: hypothetical protein AABY22_00065 [Nanoarchaeota archaeon]
MKKIKLPIIYIKWRDHCWISGNVQKIPDIKNAKPYFMEEVGFLISEDKEKIVYSQCITEGFDGKKNNIDYDNVIIVLKTDVIEMKILTPAK